MPGIFFFFLLVTIKIMKICFIFIFLIFCSPIHAAQYAVVSSKKAVIFSDVSLESPIGYINRGKKIKVGEVKRRHGTILPVVVSGRVAYIQVKDLNLEKEFIENSTRTVRDHEIDRDEIEKDSWDENNFVIFNYSQMESGNSWDELTNEFGGQNSNSLSSWEILFEHRPLFGNLSWGIGAHYKNIENEVIGFKTLSVSGHLDYSLYRGDFVMIDLNVALSASGDARLKTFKNASEYKGALFGTSFGGKAKLFSRSKLGIVVGANFTNLSPSGMDEIENPNNSNQTKKFNGLNGLNLYAGISYKL